MMTDRSKSMTWVLLFVEAAPLVAFSCSGRLGLEFPHRFYVGAGFAVLSTGFLLTRRWRFNPLLIAANGCFAWRRSRSAPGFRASSI